MFPQFQVSVHELAVLSGILLDPAASWHCLLDGRSGDAFADECRRLYCMVCLESIVSMKSLLEMGLFCVCFGQKVDAQCAQRAPGLLALLQVITWHAA